MKVFFTLLILSSALFSFNQKRTGDGGTTKSLIIQFTNGNFEKRIPEIVSNLKGIKGLFYLSHCTAQNLFVMDFDLHVAGSFPIEKIVKEKIPADLPYNIKE